YILLFATAFIIDPFASFSLASIAIFFLLLTPRKDLLSEIVQLFSLIVIAPLANLFGKEHQKNLLKQAKINLLEYQEQALSEEVKDQELAVEKWTKLILREKLIRIWKSLEKLSHILKNPHMEEEIRTIKENLKDILVSSEKLDEYIKR
ncbi:MAG: hypothetical protein NC913_03790, partial [Candidatus Omnitrophica bacterium]|nr:hypothetical protein [Candidatus Omnitrophota bacterium]